MASNQAGVGSSGNVVCVTTGGVAWQALNIKTGAKLA